MKLVIGRVPLDRFNKRKFLEPRKYMRRVDECTQDSFVELLYLSVKWLNQSDLR